MRVETQKFLRTSQSSMLLFFFLPPRFLPSKDGNRDPEGVADVVTPNYDPSWNQPRDEDKRGGRKRKPPVNRRGDGERCVERVCKTAAGLSTPDWRLLVVALPSAVYSRTGISLRTFLRQRLFVSERLVSESLSSVARSAFVPLPIARRNDPRACMGEISFDRRIKLP